MSDSPTQPGPVPTPDEVVDRARTLVPLLVEQQSETERRGVYSPEIHEAMVDAGLYLITHPRRYGGLELDLDTFYRVVVEITRGCASSGMCFALGAGHTVALAAYWPEDVQAEILQEGPFIAPLTANPQLKARKVDGGWRLDGTVNFCTSAPYANYYWGHAFPDVLTGDGEPAPQMQVLVPRSEWTLLQDDDSPLGLRGSGSPSISVRDGFVPDRFTVQDSNMLMLEPSDGSTPGAQLHDNPLYNGRPMSWFSTEFTAMAVGIAKGALDEFARLMETRQTPFPPLISRTEDYDYQLWYGEAFGRIVAAEGVLESAVALMSNKAADGTFSLNDDLLVTRLSIETMQICWETLHRCLMRSAGASEIRAGTRMERAFRDYAQLYFHDGYQLLCEAAARDLARVRFDVDAPPTTRTLKG